MYYLLLNSPYLKFYFIMINTLNIPDSNLPRLIIVGAGFAGLTLANKIDTKKYQVILLDENNHHQFQPLFYQVAMSGLEPSSISFPLRKAMQGKRELLVRLAKLERVDTVRKVLYTNMGFASYDKIVFCMGAKTNYYGNKKYEKVTYGLKSISDALTLRNDILKDFEHALLIKDRGKRQGYIDFVVVGGGATGVEVAGALAEIRDYILPKDYKELDNKEVDIYLVQGGEYLLEGMSMKSSIAAEDFLKEMGVKVIKNMRVEDIVGDQVILGDGSKLHAKKVIWAAGVSARPIEGLPNEVYGPAKRIMIDSQLRIKGFTHHYCLGDQAILLDEKAPKGHPQVAQTAIQQAKHLAKVLNTEVASNFVYNDKGSMATIGRNKAVVDLPKFHFHGFFAWLVWLVVHLFSIVGVKNKVFVFFNWVWSYITFDQSLRLIIQSKSKVD